MRGSSLQWSFSKTSATTSQILSFQSALEKEGSHKLCPPGFPQRNLPSDNKQGGNQYPVTGHRWPPNDVLTAPEAKLLNAPTLTTSFVGATSAVSSISILPPYCSVVGSTDLKNSPSVSSGSCQLTIFYNESVCVYDNVAPEKVQAIMLLAGNGDSTNTTAPSTSIHFLSKVQPTLLSLSVNDTPILDQSKSFPGAISLPISVSSLPPIQSNGTIEVNKLKAGILSTQIKGSEAPKSGVPIGSSGASAAVPQARKASLARFLEKRKGR